MGKATSNTLAQSIQTNPASIRRTIIKLREAGYIKSLAGNKGFELNTTLDKINCFDIYVLFNQNKSIVTMHSPTNSDCEVGRNVTSTIKKQLTLVELAMKKELEKLTVEDILNDLNLTIENESELLINAKKLFHEGIEQGNYKDAIIKYTSSDYKQYLSGEVLDQKGFINYFDEFTKRNPTRQFYITKSFQNEDMAFLFIIQTLNGKSEWITMDIVCADEDDKILEHYIVIDKYQKLDQVTFNYTPTENNEIDNIDNYLLDNLINVSKINQEDNHSIYNTKEYQINKIVKSLSMNNFYAYLTELNYKEELYTAILLLKVSNNEIVEYWDVLEKINKEK